MASKYMTRVAFDFLRHLWGLDHALDRASKRMIRDLGVSGPQRVVLRLVVEAEESGRTDAGPGEIGPGEIAEQMKHHPATVSSLLNRLEEHGLISRRESQIDRRRTIVVVTEAGRALGSRTTGTVESRVAAVLQDQDPADVAACLRVIEALTEGLDPTD